MPPNTTRVQGDTRQSRSTSRKRLSDYTNAPSKCTCSSSPTKDGMSPVGQDRVCRRVIVRGCGKALYRASSPAALLAALMDCIEEHRSLYARAGMLQRGVLLGNLMISEKDSNPSSTSILRSLSFWGKCSGARSKIGTRAFVAIGWLLDEKHSFRHDLESLFWVLHYRSPNEESRVCPCCAPQTGMYMRRLEATVLLSTTCLMSD
jgi:hypothetical protein